MKSQFSRYVNIAIGGPGSSLGESKVSMQIQIFCDCCRNTKVVLTRRLRVVDFVDNRR